jgi:hypothetical protein
MTLNAAHAANVVDLRDARAGRDELNAAHITELGADLAQLIELHARQISLLEARMARVGELLRIAQPPGYGKYDVRWWRQAGKAGKRRAPVLVRWVQAAQSDKFKVVQVSHYWPDKARRKGAFGVCADEARELVLLFLELRREYRQTLRRLAQLRATFDVVVRGAQTSLDESASTMDGLQKRVVDKLLAAGYAVEARYRI